MFFLLRILAGHESIPKLHCWFSLRATQCHAIVCNLYRMDEVPSHERVESHNLGGSEMAFDDCL